MDVGTKLTFSIEAPGLGDPILLRGSVRWVVTSQDASAGRPAGMGIEFLFDSNERVAVEGRLERLMAASLGTAAFEKLMGKPSPPGNGHDR